MQPSHIAAFQQGYAAYERNGVCPYLPSFSFNSDSLRVSWYEGFSLAAYYAAQNINSMTKEEYLTKYPEKRSRL